MILNKPEKITILQIRIETLRLAALFGRTNLKQAENKIRKMKGKIGRLGGNPEQRIVIETLEVGGCRE